MIYALFIPIVVIIAFKYRFLLKGKFHKDVISFANSQNYSLKNGYCLKLNKGESGREFKLSQSRQDDEVFKRFFFNCCQGVVVEVGANDGVKNSNSHFFELALNWTSYCIEASPSSFKALKKNRPTCISREVAIHESSGNMEFINLGREESRTKKFRNGQMSGLMDSWEKDRLVGNTKLAKKNANNIILVNSEPLQDVFREWNLKHINFMSIDVEGGELSTIRSINWDEVKVDVITVEIHDEFSDKARMIRKELFNVNYELVTRTGEDEIYKHRDFREGGENIC